MAQYLEEISRYPRLTRAEEVALSRRARAGDEEAQRTLVTSNLRLVVSICKDFTRNRFSLLELVSLGNEGLMIAARKYNGDRGVPFANYAAYWVKQRTMKYMAEQGFPVRIPPYRAAIFNQVVRVHAKLMQLLGRAPLADEVVEHLNAEIKAKPLAGKRKRKPVTLTEVQEVLKMLQPALELDAPLTEENDAATIGAYFGESTGDAERRLDDNLATIDMQRAVASALEGLAERERRVLEWYFGLNGQRPLDLEHIAARLKVTRERARQIKAEALKKLSGHGGLRDLLE